ncbi:DUF2309 domain-containing protein [bacterium]|nr:DUF2309 domain-containing protein [bacterium]
MKLKAVPSQSVDVKALLASVARWLPTQGPLKEFIQLNTLSAFQNRPFHEGVRVASSLYGARPYLDISWYQTEYLEGRISPGALNRVLEKEVSNASEREKLRTLMLDPNCPPLSPPPGIAKTGIRAQWLEAHFVDVDYLCQPLLVRLISNYLDQGVAIWRLPAANKPFWECIRDLVTRTWLPISPLTDRAIREQFSRPPEAVVADCLPRLVDDPAFYEEYIKGLLLTTPGWIGLANVVEHEPGGLLARRSITLMDCLALGLLLEVGWLQRKLGKDFKPLSTENWKSAPDLEPETPSCRAARLWHEAMEWHYRDDLLGALEGNAVTSAETGRPPSVQAFFCIDDREEGIRRHLEETNYRIDTFSTPGFFGVDFLFQGLQSAYPAQQCPNILRPKHLVYERPRDPERYKTPRLTQLLHLAPSSNTLFRGFIISQTLGLWTAFRLAFNVFRPTIAAPTEKALSKVDVHTELHLFRKTDEPTPEGLLLGYSLDEMADRVANLLKSVGLTKSFSNLIVFLAHGGASVNNPHYAAYDCGACSSKPGAPNARSIAIMANCPEVRRKLVERGIELPTTCRFLGGIHNTTQDEVTYFDLEELPATHKALFDEFNNSIKEALKKNAKERTRRFRTVPLGLSVNEAHTHVRNRAMSIFEPRPELDHMTNAATIVGRRRLTKSLFMDRRVFLNSYDPTQDPEGKILGNILNAAIPVCGGINLCYFFSRIDNTVYGAGTKLPHNVVGLVGVSNGVEGDLRTGLPSQMIEVHDPLRLLMLVEQEPQVALAAAKRNPANFEWIENGWMTYAAFSPSENVVYVYEKGEMVRPGILPRLLPTAKHSLEVVAGQRGNIPVHQIERVIR